MGIDGVDKLLGVGEALPLHLILWEGWQLTLLLQDDDIPAAGLYHGHGLVAAMLHERTASRGIGTVCHAISCALCNVGHHLWQVIDLGVTVAYEQNVGFVLRMQYVGKG